MKKKQFNESDLQSFMTEYFEELASSVDDGQYDTVADAYMYSCVNAMNDAVIMMASAEDLFVLNWEIPVSGRSPLKIWAYSVDENNGVMNIFARHFYGHSTLMHLNDQSTKTLANSIITQLAKRVRSTQTIEDYDSDVELFLEEIRSNKFWTINIYILTDAIASTKKFKPHCFNEEQGIYFHPEVFDISRLFATANEENEEIIVNFNEISKPLEAVVIQGKETDCYLTAIPGNVLQQIYSTYGQRILEGNVRSFLSFKTNVNKAIKKTIIDEPENFLTFNNGLVMVAEKVNFDTETSTNHVKITGLIAPQIVNGGQTTVSIALSKSENLSKVWVNLKIIDISKALSKNEDDPFPVSDKIDEAIQRIAVTANTQNKINASDLTSNNAWNKKLKQLSEIVKTKDDQHWFFERTNGSYTTFLAEQPTQADRNRMKKIYPREKKIQKSLVARLINTWRGEVPSVAKGREKNNAAFNVNYVTKERVEALGSNDYRRIVAMAILEKKIFSMVSTSKLTPYHQMTTTYLMGLIGRKYGKTFNFDNIWVNQELSKNFIAQLEIWIIEIIQLLEDKLPANKDPREWMKTDNCWNSIKSHDLSTPEKSNIPELSSN